jgi:hypothetical protein
MRVFFKPEVVAATVSSKPLSEDFFGKSNWEMMTSADEARLKELK